MELSIFKSVIESVVDNSMETNTGKWLCDEKLIESIILSYGSNFNIQNEDITDIYKNVINSAGQRRKTHRNLLVIDTLGCFFGGALAGLESYLLISYGFNITFFIILLISLFLFFECYKGIKRFIKMKKIAGIWKEQLTECNKSDMILAMSRIENIKKNN